MHVCVCVCMFVCMYVCMCVCMFVYIHKYIYVCVCVQMLVGGGNRDELPRILVFLTRMECPSPPQFREWLSGRISKVEGAAAPMVDALVDVFADRRGELLQYAKTRAVEQMASCTLLDVDWSVRVRNL